MSVFGVILVRIFPHSDWIYSVSLCIQSKCGKIRTRKIRGFLRVLEKFHNARSGRNENIKITSLDNLFQRHAQLAFASFVIRTLLLIMQRKRVSKTKKPRYKNNDPLRFPDFVSTKDHFTSTHPRCFVKKGILGWFLFKLIIRNKHIYCTCFLRFK